jgi:hypothetical protein
MLDTIVLERISGKPCDADGALVSVLAQPVASIATTAITAGAILFLFIIFILHCY